MSLAIASILLRVIAEVFDDRVEVLDEGFSPSSPDVYLVHLLAHGRGARLVASDEWSEAQLDLGVHYTDLHEGADEAEAADAYRRLALLVRAYLDGTGRVTYRRSLLPRRPPVPRYTVIVNGTRYRLGPYSYSSC